MPNEHFTIPAMQDTLNGHQVIGSCLLPDKPGNKKARIVLVDRGPEYDNMGHRYATALHCIDQASWDWGHYIKDEVDARKDFAERVIRGY
jgi:hypothetical protein